MPNRRGGGVGAVGDHLHAGVAPVGGVVPAYDVLGLADAVGRDEVFRQLVLARIIEPTSKQDSLRGAGGGRCRRRVRSDPEPAAAALRRRRCRGGWPRRARRTRSWPELAGCSTTSARRVSRPPPKTGSASRVLQGTQARAADHHRAAHRRRGFPVDGRGVRGQQGRDRDHAAGDHRVHGRLPAAGGDRGCRHRGLHIEKSFRMFKHDLRARPIYHHKRELIQAHLAIVVRRPGRHPVHRGPHRLVACCSSLVSVCCGIVGHAEPCADVAAG
jgi:hypothetical protein